MSVSFQPEKTKVALLGNQYLVLETQKVWSDSSFLLEDSHCGLLDYIQKIKFAM